MKENQEEYIQIGLPDTKRLAQMIEEGRGFDRTMAQYADACGVSAATLSRIVNGKITKPVATELIEKLAENSCYSSPLIFENMMAANGMQKKSVYMSLKAKREMSYKLMEGSCLISSAIHRRVLASLTR